PLRISGGVLTGEFSWKLAAANRAASVVPLALLTYLIMQGKQELFEDLAQTTVLTTYGLPWW
ncbi:MAG: hypothetical protein KBI47_08445, partial [Armatimonadetes bacterium]|nr:hypothetical protein [Armatimonadota bacterium]MDI9586842.1 hypothetical protein [Acidobacteriota bacterium]